MKVASSKEAGDPLNARYHSTRSPEIIRYYWENLLTKLHEDRKINVASIVLTRKNAPPPDIIGMNLLTNKCGLWTIYGKIAPPFKRHANIIIFEVIQDIIDTNLLTKFHEDWTINVASRDAPPLFHDDRKINVTSKVLTRKNAPPPVFHEDRTINVASRENAPPLGSHDFQANVTIFELF
ncbi:hypothetical protein DPMN_140635 [Dreissena polymorpha]|uniref:Uncharacterized protein n=1 Tax=Dreissena polymorpha TaxID=45954 RepID=A0A9D4JGV4_DREPO|nr:hypothetical protein DPMN_140635 [Dreissena polymorpha]